jgi:hypothetical protein
MSAFTDEDLRRLKGSAYFELESDWLKALVARLEAAESVIEAQALWDQAFDVQENTGYRQLHDLESAKRAWHKAAGK